MNGPENAADVFQETLLAIWQGIVGFSGEASFRTWCLSIARRKIADHFRRARHEVFPLDEAENIPIAEPLFDRSLDRLALRNALSSLSGQEQELFYLVFLAELRMIEAADLLGIPLGTVKSRLAALRAKLKRLLQEEMKE